MATSTSTAPAVLAVKRESGIAGQYGYVATVQYAGEEPETVRFVGSTYGGPIVMVSPGGSQVFVSASVTDRLGSTLDESWVRAFLA